MLGLGAWLVLRGELTPGAMIAGSILMGRALAPIEQAIGQWALVQRAAKGWESLAELLGSVPPEQPRTPLPRPKARLEVSQLTMVPPGESQAVLKTLSFKIEPGQAVGVIGPSGAGKSTLARAITGVWRPAGGKIRLDGATLDQYAPNVLGELIGYLPQRVQLFDGTIADNIARGGRLSGGQMQRIGLARAMYGDPMILVLDEPNSNLDNEGSEAVNLAIRSFKAEGKAVIVVAHRPAAIKECDMLLMLEAGVMRAFGPREKVLKDVLQNHQQVTESTGPGGVR